MKGISARLKVNNNFVEAPAYFFTIAEIKTSLVSSVLEILLNILDNQIQIGSAETQRYEELRLYLHLFRRGKKK